MAGGRVPEVVRLITSGSARGPSDPEFDDVRHTRFVPPEAHFAAIRSEQAKGRADPPSSRRTKVIIKRALREPVPAGVEGIDWRAELAGFGELAYPSYYLQPFHSVAGGWLSKRAAVQNRMFMQGIYRDADPDSCMGLRRRLSGMVPKGSRVVVDLGCGDGDGPACTAAALPAAQVVGVDASPFMIIAGRRQNAGVPNLRFAHSLAEDTGLPDGSVDCVTITLVFHECSDVGKVAIAQEAKRILRPGGTLVFADTPQDDLFTYVGAYEPHREEWKNFRPAEFFGWLGFRDFRDCGVLGGERVITEEEHRRLSTAKDGERTDNRLFACTMKKAGGQKGSAKL